MAALGSLPKPESGKRLKVGIRGGNLQLNGGSHLQHVETPTQSEDNMGSMARSSRPNEKGCASFDTG